MYYEISVASYDSRGYFISSRTYGADSYNYWDKIKLAKASAASRSLRCAFVRIYEHQRDDDLKEIKANELMYGYVGGKIDYKNPLGTR